MTIFATDAFTGILAAGALGGRTATDGGTWTAPDGAGIGGATGGDKVHSTSSAGRISCYHSGTPASADYTVALDVTLVSTGKTSLGPAGRMGTGALADKYWIEWSGGNGWVIMKRSGGTDTQIAGASNTNIPTTTKTATLDMVGTAIKCNISGASNPLLTATDGSITAAGKAGIHNDFADDTTGSNDNFVATDGGGGGGGGGLPLFMQGDLLTGYKQANAGGFQ